jgi:hypothetical protein
MGDQDNWQGTVYRLSGDRRQRILLRKQEMFVLHASEYHKTLDSRSVIYAMNTGPCGHT